MKKERETPSAFHLPDSDVVSQVFCRQIFCRQINRSSTASTITQYRAHTISKSPFLPRMRIVVPHFALLVQPWRDWENGETPKWGRSHNKVKREQNSHCPDANIESVFTAVAGRACWWQGLHRTSPGMPRRCLIYENRPHELPPKLPPDLAACACELTPSKAARTEIPRLAAGSISPHHRRVSTFADSGTGTEFRMQVDLRSSPN